MSDYVVKRSATLDELKRMRGGESWLLLVEGKRFWVNCYARGLFGRVWSIKWVDDQRREIARFRGSADDVWGELVDWLEK